MRRATEPAPTTEALDRLVDGQTAANKRGEVKKWPDEWAKSPAAAAAAQPVK